MAKTPTTTDLDMSPAETAAENERLRLRIAELEQATTAAPAPTLTSQREIDAGEDETGVQRWWYTPNLPPSGGQSIKINGFDFFHGEQYKIRTETLRTIKEIEHRSWQQEDLIHGANENFYRRETAPTINKHGVVK